MDLISVIVPVYRTEPWLDQCVASLVRQTYGCLEILLVDDGSPDGCPDLCDRWAQRDPRVRVLHQENQGPSEARNAGIAAARGDYIAFVDSDDWVEPDFLAILHQAAVSCQTPLAGCGYDRPEDPSQSARPILIPSPQILLREELLLDVIRDRRMGAVVCNKLYARALLEGLSFPPGKRCEDEFFSHLPAGRAERGVYVDAALYHYRPRQDSFMSNPWSLRRLDAVEAKVLRLRYLEAAHPALIPAAWENLLFTCLYQGQMALRYLDGPDRDRVFSSLRDTLHRNPMPENMSDAVKPTHRVWAALARRSLRGTCLLRNLLKVGF